MRGVRLAVAVIQLSRRRNWHPRALRAIAHDLQHTVDELERLASALDDFRRGEVDEEGYPTRRHYGRRPPPEGVGTA